jgi:hypothetical protein
MGKGSRKKCYFSRIPKNFLYQHLQINLYGPAISHFYRTGSHILARRLTVLVRTTYITWPTGQSTCTNTWLINVITIEK